MVCALPAELKKIIDRYKDCNAYTHEPTGEERVKEGGGWGRGDPACEDGLVAAMKRFGTPNSKYGVHRRVFKFTSQQGEDCVVKVARTIGQRDDEESRQGGTGANKAERKDYKTLPSSIKDVFLPIGHLERDGWYVTAPEVELVEDMDDPSAACSEAKYDIEERLGKYGCGDMHCGNIGYYKGDPVIIDYGFGVKGCKRKISTATVADKPRARPHIPPPRLRATRFGRGQLSLLGFTRQRRR